MENLNDIYIFFVTFLNEHLIIAPLIFVFTHIIFAVLFLPCSFLALLAGFIWGPLFGWIIIYIAALLSCMSTFIITRSKFKSRILIILKKKLPARHFLYINKDVSWKLIAAVQLNLLLPSSSFGYLFGITKCPFKKYFFTTAIILIPMTLFMVNAGSILKNYNYIDKVIYSIIFIILGFLIFHIMKIISAHTK